MRLLFTGVCAAVAALGQYLPIGGVPIGAGGSNPQFVQAKGTDSASASTSIAQTITVGSGGHQLHVVASNQNSGDIINTTISDTANSSWYPVCPAGQANCAILSAIVTNGGLAGCGKKGPAQGRAVTSFCRIEGAPVLK